MQSAAWMRCRAADGYAHFAILLRDERQQFVGGAVVGRWQMQDEAFYYIQDGPLLPEEPELAAAVMQALLARLEHHREADKQTVSHLRIEPRCGSEASAAFTAFGFVAPTFDDRFREPRHTRIVDLRLTEAARLTSMSAKGRYNVQLARRHGVRVVTDSSPQGLEDFIAIRGDTATRKQLSRKSRGYFESILREFGPRARLHFAELDGQRLATALTVVQDARATYLFGGSLPVRREVMAPYLLQHELMNQLADEGFVSYDLFGIAPPGDSQHAWRSISEFKRKLGGTEEAFVPTLDHVYDAAAYARFAQREGLAVARGSMTDALDSLHQPGAPHHVAAR